MKKPSTRIQFTEAELTIITLALNAYKDESRENALAMAKRLEDEGMLPWREAFRQGHASWSLPLDTAKRKLDTVREKLDDYHWTLRDAGE